jgi:hypothetical protein
MVYGPGQPAGFALGGVIFFLIWLLLMGGMIVGWVIFLVAIWRGMKAHEMISMTLERIADNLKRARQQ